MAKTPDFTGVVLGVYIGQRTDSLVTDSRMNVEVTLEGFKGDKHSGFTLRSDARTPQYPRGTLIRNSRQVSIVSQEELKIVAVRLQVSEICPEWLGANLYLAGIPQLTQLPAMTRIHFPGEASLLLQGENMPCINPGNVIQSQFPERTGLDTGFPQAANHLRGVVACVERPGQIAQGDEVRVFLPG